MNIQDARTTSADAVLLRENDGPVAVLTLNRPAARNSLSEALLGALAEALTVIAEDNSVRAVVLAASGSAFCAGHDLKELTGRRSDADGGRAYFQQIMNTCSAMMQQIVTMPQPVIAAVQAIATAAGCQLVASCDLAVASRTAKFATPGVNLGLFCSTPMVALSRAIGRKRALQMLLTGQPIDAPTAADWGLVNEVVPADRLDARTREIALNIANASSLVVGIGKEAFYRQIDLDQRAAYDYTKTVMTMNALAGDAQDA